MVTVLLKVAEQLINPFDDLDDDEHKEEGGDNDDNRPP